jgi:hypothetical protein
MFLFWHLISVDDEFDGAIHGLNEVFDREAWGSHVETWTPLAVRKCLTYSRRQFDA